MKSRTATTLRKEIYIFILLGTLIGKSNAYTLDVNRQKLLMDRNKQMVNDALGLSRRDFLKRKNPVIKRALDPKRAANSVEMPYSNTSPNTVTNPSKTVTPAIKAVKNRALTQEKIEGRDLEKIILKGRRPYRIFNKNSLCTLVYPQHLKEIILCAASYFAELATLHNAGFVHCNIEARHLIILDDRFAGYPVYIIDRSRLTKIGKAIQTSSISSAPEFMEVWNAKESCTYQCERYEKRLNEIKKNLPEANNDELFKLKLKKTIKTLKKKVDTFIFPAAQPSYDIYLSAGILLAILFGERGLELAQHLYLYKQNHSISHMITSAHPLPTVQANYVLEAQKTSFSVYAYFLEKFDRLNQEMYDVTGQSYPQPIVEALAELQGSMSSLNPQERPSAIEISKMLRNMALSAAWEKWRIFPSRSKIRKRASSQMSNSNPFFSNEFPMGLNHLKH
ncbi:MAG: hypothetical protein LBB11_02005 [Puniceicoccales bacterium]|jgi:serine/threonine protein kinase|nr:hypothetical protein [Puniceicoccales bacterium]